MMLIILGALIGINQACGPSLTRAWPDQAILGLVGVSCVVASCHPAVAADSLQSVTEGTDGIVLGGGLGTFGYFLGNGLAKVADAITGGVRELSAVAREFLGPTRDAVRICENAVAVSKDLTRAVETGVKRDVQ